MILAFGLLITLAAAQGILSLYYVGGFSASVARMYDEDLLGIRGLDQTRSHLDRAQFALVEHLFANDTAQMQVIAATIQQERAQIATWRCWCRTFAIHATVGR